MKSIGLLEAMQPGPAIYGNLCTCSIELPNLDTLHLDTLLNSIYPGRRPERQVRSEEIRNNRHPVSQPGHAIRLLLLFPPISGECVRLSLSRTKEFL